MRWNTGDLVVTTTYSELESFLVEGEVTDRASQATSLLPWHVFLADCIKANSELWSLYFSLGFGGVFFDGVPCSPWMN